MQGTQTEGLIHFMAMVLVRPLNTDAGDGGRKQVF